MLRVTVLCVGRLKEACWREACAEYRKRLTPFCRLEIVEVEEERAPEHPSAAQLAAVVRAEGERLLQKLPAGAAVIPLCIEGAERSSEQLAEAVARMTAGGVSHIALVIGGSWGLSEAVKQRGNLRLSMSPMTFPHQLARVMLLEQLYRVCQINSGGAYHK